MIAGWGWDVNQGIPYLGWGICLICTTDLTRRLRRHPLPQGEGFFYDRGRLRSGCLSSGEPGLEEGVVGDDIKGGQDVPGDELAVEEQDEQSGCLDE